MLAFFLYPLCCSLVTVDREGNSEVNGLDLTRTEAGLVLTHCHWPKAMVGSASGQGQPRKG